MNAIVGRLAALAGSVDLSDDFARGLRSGYLAAALEVGDAPKLGRPRVANRGDALAALREAAEAAPVVSEVIEAVAEAIEGGLL